MIETRAASLKRRNYLLFLAASQALAAGTLAEATTYTWNGPAAGGSWQTAANWSPATGYPSLVADSAIINNSAGTNSVIVYSGASGGATTIGSLSITQTSPYLNEVDYQQTLTGTLNVSSGLTLGASNGGTAEIFLDPIVSSTQGSKIQTFNASSITLNPGGVLEASPYEYNTSNYTTTTISSNVTINGGTLYSDQAQVSAAGDTDANTITGSLTMTSGLLSLGLHTSTGNASHLGGSLASTADRLYVFGNLNITGGTLATGYTTDILYLEGQTNSIQLTGNTPILAQINLQNLTNGAVQSFLSDSPMTGGIAFRQQSSSYAANSITRIGAVTTGTLNTGQLVYKDLTVGGLQTVQLASNVITTAVPGYSGNAASVTDTIDTDGYTLTLNEPGTTFAPQYGSLGIWNYNNSAGAAAIGTIAAPAFNTSGPTGGSSVGGYTNLQATNGGLIDNLNNSNGSIAATSIFTYAPTFNTSFASTLVSGRPIGNLAVTAGTLVLGSNISMGASTTLTLGGTLNLSTYALTTAPNLTATGGTLLNAATTTSFGAANFSSGSSFIKNTNGTVALNAITRSVGATVDFTNTGAAITTSNGNTNGILGGYATVAGTDWATVSSGNIVALPGSSYTPDTWASGNNTDVTLTTNSVASGTTNTLRFNRSQASTVTLTGTNTITSGGILVTANVGSGHTTNISGGVLEGSAGGDLVLIQNNTASNMIIGSQIEDNTSAAALTKSGTGTLILTGANLYTGSTFINGGTLQLGDGTTGHDSSLTSSGIFNNGILTFDTFATQSYGSVISGTGILNKFGVGTTTLSGINTYSGGTNVATGTLIVTSAGSLAAGSGLNVNSSGSATLAYVGPNLGVVTNADTAVGSLNFNATTGTVTLYSLSGPGNTNFASNATIGTFAGAGTSTLTIAGIANFTNVSGGALNLNGPTATISNSLSTGGGFINLGNTVLTVTDSGTGMMGGAITGANGSLIVDGGTLKLTSTNTYGGGTTVTAGTLIVNGSNGSLASGSALAVGASGSAIIASLNPTLGAVSNANTSTASLNFNNTSGTVTLASLNGVGNTNFASNATVTGLYSGGTATVAGIGTFNNVSSGTLNLNGSSASISMLNGGTIHLGTVSTALTISNGGTTAGSITGLGSLIVSGGTLNLSGINNYSGGTTLTAGTLVAGATNALSASSSFNVAGGTLDVSGYNNSIAALTVGPSGTLKLGFGNLLSTSSAASFAGTLNLLGTAPATSSLPETLISYASETGTFTTVTGLPSNDQLNYTPTGLQLAVLVSSGPATLNWTNASGNSLWDTTSTNFNTSSSNTPVAYSDTSSSTTAPVGDIVQFTDNNNGNYNVSIPGTVHPTSVTVTTNNAYNFGGAGSIAGPGSLTLSGSGSLTLAEANSYQGGTNVSGGTLYLAQAGALPSAYPLTIGSGAKVVAMNLGTAYASTVSTLNISGGTLDLNNNDLVIHNSQTAGNNLTAVSALVTTGFNGGAWNGPTGIISTTAAQNTTHLTALGVIVNDSKGVTGGGGELYGASGTLASTFGGVAPALDDVLVKYTYYGDTNLDGKVDGSDYSAIDSTYLQEMNTSTAISGWQNGDFNYDGVVNGSDYTLIDNAFNSQGAQISAELATPTAEIAVGGGVSAVPEPTSMSLLVISTLGLLGRRTRRFRMGR
jgi:fibronectin-binding autotransporter adhesin